MMQNDYLELALAHIVAGEVPPDPANDPWQLAVAAFAASNRLDHAAATNLSTRALELLGSESDAVARAAAYGARAFAASAEPDIRDWNSTAPGLTPTGDPLSDALPLLERLGDTDPAEFTRYLLAEAALSCARVTLASELPLPDPSRFLMCGGRPHEFSAVLTVLAVRIAAFNGRVAEAAAAIEHTASDTPLFDLLLDATRSLVLGNAADPGRTRALVDRISTQALQSDNRIAVGCSLLAGYGLIALGDVRGAVALLLRSGGGADLERLMITDRAISFEMLVNHALLDDDLDAAEAWAERAEPLAASPIADATVNRVRSRILLARGDAAGAVQAAERAGGRARAEGRLIEASESDILAARAAKAGGESGRRLQLMAQEAGRTGHHAAVRAAAHELRAAGRRLRPRSGTEWAGLSEREREVAELLLEGLSNAEIAVELYLSPHTVRVHISRVLAAFGVASRFALAARVAGRGQAIIETVSLTARQRAVVAELTTGASNAEIAARLGISTKTVEKHLHEAMQRLGVTSRVGVLRRVTDPAAAVRIDGE